MSSILPAGDRFGTPYAHPVGESFRIKIVQTLRKPSYDVRVSALKDASYNVLRLRRDQVYLDFATTRGNAGLTDKQLSALMVGDEAYAGSANFHALERTSQEVLGKRYLIPTHQGRGAEHLILRGLLRAGQRVVTNGNVWTLRPLAQALGLHLDSLLDDQALEPSSKTLFKADLPLEKLEDILGRHPVDLVVLGTALRQFGGQPLSLDNVQAVAAVAKRHGIPLVLDGSMLASAAFQYQHQQSATEDLRGLMLRYAECADIVYMSGREDAGCHTGGLIATDSEEWYKLFRGLVVVYEGLHTYGGQAGRDMQVLAQGLRDMSDESYLAFRQHKLAYLADHVERLGFSVFRPLGFGGICLDCRSVPGFATLATSPGGPGETAGIAANLAALFYLVSGNRTRPVTAVEQGDGKEAGSVRDVLGVFVPRRCYTERQIDYAIESFGQLTRYQITNSLRRDKQVAESPELMRYQVDGSFITDYHDDFVPTYSPEPYFIKVVEPFRLRSADERTRAIDEAGQNTFLLRSEDIYIDLLTDSGTAAMSSQQWAAMLEVQESELGSDAHRLFVDRCHEILGFRYILPTHQGRAAEHLLSQALIRSGQYVVNNMYFTTTREHQERAGGVFVDLIVNDAYDPQSPYPFKGDIDPKKLQAFIAEHGAERIAYVCLETNVNMAGGQPISMSATREISAICHYYRIPLIFDATRVAENAYLIKQRETAYASWTIKEIIHELMALGDGCTISAKKDVLVNIGGLLGLRDRSLYERCSALAIVYEGIPWSGGLASRDLAAMAVGLDEMTEYAYISSRVEQVHYLWQRLRSADVPVVEPPGGHAVFLDARRFLPHVSQEVFPAQRLAAALYESSGVRGMERGIVSAGRDPETGRHRPSKLELVRLTIPRRVYTYSHMDVVADGVVTLFKERDTLKGLRMVYEPPTLRFFTARFERL